MKIILAVAFVALATPAFADKLDDAKAICDQHVTREGKQIKFSGGMQTECVNVFREHALREHPELRPAAPAAPPPSHPDLDKLRDLLKDGTPQ